MIWDIAETELDNCRVRSWARADLDKYEAGGIPPRLTTKDGSEVRRMKQVR